MSELANDEFDKDYWFEMYQGQCKTTDDWAKKYRDEVERKADATLLARCEELQRIAEVANAMVGKERDQTMRQAKRITELEASLADSNEALQVMGLKLAHAEAANARLSGEREQLNEQLRKMGADWLATAINGEAEKLPATRIKNLVEQHGSYRKVGELLDVDHAYLHRIAHGEKGNMSDDMLRKLGLRRGTFYADIGTHSANTVGGPTPVMDAAPACERKE